MFRLIALGGTFDRLHRGHQFFLAQAFKHGRRVLIGLSSDQFAQKKLETCQSKFKTKIESYRVRQEKLSRFLKRKKLGERTKIVKIADLYGPTLRRKDIKALLVTRETLKGGREINRQREKLGFPLLKLIVAPSFLAEDKKRISSLRIRRGEIDRRGMVLSKIKIVGLPISESLRRELKKPLGVLLKGDPQESHRLLPKLKKLINLSQPITMITVGDETTKLLNEAGLFPQLAIIDYKVMRKKKYHRLAQLGFSAEFQSSSQPRLSLVRNRPGLLSRTLVKAVKKAIKTIWQDARPRIIRVLGEEDLAALPAILLAPLDSLVLYGQPEKGIVVVKITEAKKQQIVNLIEKTEES